MPSLVEIAAESSYELDKYLHYFDVYEKHLKRFVGQSFCMIEIGVNQGGSLFMWREYFGKGVRIVGIDLMTPLDLIAL